VPPPVARIEPRLVVLIVIDQWPTWVFEKQKQLFTGGIGRLLREGAVVMAAELPYANTFTAVGHATIGTGTTPDVHGIVGNSWWRRDEGRDRPAEYDRESTTLRAGKAIGNEKEVVGASGRALRSEGVADVLRRATAGTARSVAISLKPRSACLMTGRQPDLAIWYDASAGGMTTSKAYVADPPAWLVQLDHDKPANRFFTSTWQPLDAALLARETKLADDAPGEKSDHGLGNVFPHSLADAKNPAHAIIVTPFADELVMQTVEAAIPELKLGLDDVPDFLAISFGAHDYAGHDWGPDSWEVLDLTLRLDASLGQLFDMLDTRVGTDRWAVVVTSDHGATPVVERSGIAGARRIPYAELEDAAERALEAQLGGPGPWVAKVSSSNVYMTAKFRELPDATRGPALDAAASAIGAVPGVGFAGRSDRFSPGCTVETGIDRALCFSIVPGAAGELYVYPSAGSGITSYAGGTTHDAPVDDNRRVPILVKAPGVAPQNGTGSLLQVAPTLSALLGTEPPEGAKAPALFGITRR
jgi:predicted AlkP superfamily pyrophosphatase or phosphodiesterase